MEEEQLNPIVQDIIKINDKLEEDFLKSLLLRLSNLGYQSRNEDCWILSFSIDKVLNHVKNACNISEIPKELNEIVIDKICGEFLFNKQKSNQLNLDNFDLELGVKNIQLGDTNVTLATSDGSETDEVKLNTLINALINTGEEDLLCYRKLRW